MQPLGEQRQPSFFVVPTEAYLQPSKMSTAQKQKKQPGQITSQSLPNHQNKAQDTTSINQKVSPVVQLPNPGTIVRCETTSGQVLISRGDHHD